MARELRIAAIQKRALHQITYTGSVNWHTDSSAPKLSGLWQSLSQGVMQVRNIRDEKHVQIEERLQVGLERSIGWSCFSGASDNPLALFTLDIEIVSSHIQVGEDCQKQTTNTLQYLSRQANRSCTRITASCNAHVFLASIFSRFMVLRTSKTAEGVVSSS